MRLTHFTDYGLRMLMFIAIKGAPASLTEIADAFHISRNHLVKVTTKLRQARFIETKRGVGGGIALARPPNDINLGDVVKAMEPDFVLVECFEPATSTCPITQSCRLTTILHQARNAFLAEVSSHTLADIVVNRRSLAALLAPGN